MIAVASPNKTAFGMALWLSILTTAIAVSLAVCLPEAHADMAESDDVIVNAPVQSVVARRLSTSSQIDAQAVSKAKVWVLINGEGMKHTYNKKGQLIQVVYGEGAGKTKRTYKYSNDRIVAVEERSQNRAVSDFRAKFTYDAKGCLAKAIIAGGGYPSGGCIETYEYNSKNQIVKTTTQGLNGEAGTVYGYKYDGNGRVSLVIQIVDSTQKYAYAYKYDAWGNPVSEVANYPRYDNRGSYYKVTTVYRNKYKNGCLISKSSKSKNGFDGTTTTGTTEGYKYKRISISSEYASQVRSQQMEMLRSFTHFLLLC